MSIYSKEAGIRKPGQFGLRNPQGCNLIVPKTGIEPASYPE
jgi:hypothetical protein